MELRLEVGAHCASIYCTTSQINPALAVAVISLDAAVLTYREATLYRASKQLALEAIAQALHVWPLVVEPELPAPYTSRQRRAATLRSS